LISRCAGGTAGGAFRRLRERLVDGDPLVGGLGRRLDPHVDVPGVRAVAGDDLQLPANGFLRLADGDVYPPRRSVVDVMIRLAERGHPIELVVDVEVDVRRAAAVLERDGEGAGGREPVRGPDRVDGVPVQFD